jgi:CRP/FNR family transcriptional regulator, anaerobic regulatory protein
MNPLITYCKTICPVSKGLELALTKHSIVNEYKAGEYILKQGKISNYACFVVNGLVRSFYTKEYDDITTKFLAETALITSIYSFYSRKPGQENIVALEDTQLICVHYDTMQRLYKDYLEFNAIVRVITERYLFFSEIEIYNLRNQSAEERYRFFLKHHPTLLQRVPLKYIASYLNMSVETLSRIRGKTKVN